MSVGARIVERISQFNLADMGPVELERFVEAEAKRFDVTVDYVHLLVDSALCMERSDVDTVEHLAIRG